MDAPPMSFSAERIAADGGAPVPMWVPDQRAIEQSNLHAAMQARGFNSYDDFHRWTVDAPEEFWSFVLERLDIKFHVPPQRMLAETPDPAAGVWLPGARLNIAESCFQADPAAVAIIEGAEAGCLSQYTYGQLHDEARRVCSGLQRRGFQPGDAIALLAPMNARSVAAYLGAILAGCAIVSIADSLSAQQVELRLRIGGAKAIITKGFLHRGGKQLPLYERVAESGLPVILLDRSIPAGVAPRPGLLPWSDFAADADAARVFYAEPTATTNVIFSSGTTGDPKAIPWDHVTPLRPAVDGHFHQDIHREDIVAWPTNFGWMMGGWLTFATLINRGTMALFEGAPVARPFGEFLSQAGVTILGVIPSLVARWRESGCMAGLDWSTIRLFTTTGECSSPADMRWLSQFAGNKPVLEYCGGTELGGGYIGSTLLHPNFPATFSTPSVGTRFLLLDEAGQPADAGEVFLVYPSLGMSHRLLNGDHRAAYYAEVPTGPNGETLRRHGDQLQRLPGGYYRVVGRCDDAINLGGIKVGPAELERVVIDEGGLPECAMIGVPHPDGGPNRLVACIGYAPADAPDKPALIAQLQGIISEKLCPLFKLDDVFFCGPLPRTASNKIMRRELRRLYEEARRDHTSG
jgi:acetyl-CoA synthetase